MVNAKRNVLAGLLVAVVVTASASGQSVSSAASDVSTTSTASTSSNAALSPARGSGPKIAFVDIDIITGRSRYVRRVLESLDKQIGERRASLERDQTEYVRLKEEIERKRAVLSDKELEVLTRQSRELRLTIDDEEAELQKFMTGVEKDQMGPAFDRVLGAIEALGKEERFDLILRGEVVLFGNPALNLTDRVIERLDRDEKTSGTLKGKEPPKANVTPEKAAVPAVKTGPAVKTEPAVKTGEAPAKAKETPRASARKPTAVRGRKPTPDKP